MFITQAQFHTSEGGQSVRVGESRSPQNTCSFPLSNTTVRLLTTLGPSDFKTFFIFPLQSTY